MVFLSKVSFVPPVRFKADKQLKDPHARSFTHVELREAMMETLKFINTLLKAAGVVGAPLLYQESTDVRLRQV